MNVEIWSGIMCPFCYIGKRHFEEALHQFGSPSEVNVVWRSFQLNPDLQTQPDKTIHEYLAEHKGFSVAQARQLNQQVTDMAKGAGLTYNLDQAVVANSFNAHRLIHLAGTKGLADAAEEALFQAYFTQGKNVDDFETLVALGTEIGLDEALVRETLHSEAYAQDVLADQNRARQVGARGVPFFVFGDKYAVSGAQPANVFLGALQKTWQETQPVVLPTADGNVCDVDGNCD